MMSLYQRHLTPGLSACRRTYTFIPHPAMASNFFTKQIDKYVYKVLVAVEVDDDDIKTNKNINKMW